MSEKKTETEANVEKQATIEPMKIEGEAKIDESKQNEAIAKNETVDSENRTEILEPEVVAAQNEQKETETKVPEFKGETKARQEESATEEGITVVAKETNSEPKTKNIRTANDEKREATGVPELKQRTKSKSIESEAKDELKYGAVHVIQLFVPISICMLAVIVTIQGVPFYAKDGGERLLYAPFSEDSEKESDKIISALGNATIMIAMVILMTFVLVMLYKFRCYLVIYIWLFVVATNTLSIFTLIYITEVLRPFNVTLDYFTMFFAIWNIAIVGMVSIFSKSPIRLQQTYLIFVSTLLALIFIKNLPPWTTWLVLIFLVFWDLIAVLCPFGPLKMLVELSKERNEPLFPSMVYSSILYLQILEAQLKHGAKEVKSKLKSLKRKKEANDSSEQKEKSPDNGTSSGVKLGLGDFIFYSVLVGNVSKQGDWNTTISCYVAILVGLSLTLVLLAIYQKALPALPISLTFAIIFYWCTSIFVQPFEEELSSSQVFI